MTKEFENSERKLEPVANIDCVDFPATSQYDLSVLLTRTKTELSVGLIKFKINISPLGITLAEKDECLLVDFDENADTSKLVSFELLRIAGPLSEKAAFDLAFSKIEAFGNSDNNQLELSEFIKDAPVNKPQITDLDGNLYSQNEELERVAAISRIQKSGLPIPVKSIVEIFKSLK